MGKNISETGLWSVDTLGPTSQETSKLATKYGNQLGHLSEKIEVS